MEKNGSWERVFELFKTHCESGGRGNLQVGQPGKDGKRRVTLSLDISLGCGRPESGRGKKKPPSRIRRDQERRKAWLERRNRDPSSEDKADRPSVIVSKDEDGVSSAAEITKRQDPILESRVVEDVLDAPLPPGRDQCENIDYRDYPMDCPTEVKPVQTVHNFTRIRCSIHPEQFIFTRLSFLNSFVCKLCEKTVVLRCEEGFLIGRNCEFSDDKVKKDIFNS